ncbi:unknown [Bacteroides sp. CAG:633]|nr:unknown [Bacteroides sp. CAG:633]
MLGFEHLAAGFEVGVQAGHFLPEVVQRTFEEVVGHEEVFLHVALLQAITGFAGQDDQLADNVLTAEVDARIGFGVTLFLRHADGAAERDVGTDLVEDVVQRAAQYGFYLQYLVATMDEVVDGVDDGQSGAHVGLEQILHTALTGYLLQCAVVFVFGRSGYLVGCHYRYVVLQQVFVERSYFGTRRTVDEDGVEDIHSDNLVAQNAYSAFLTLCGEFFTEVGQVEPLAGKHRSAGIGDTYNIELQTVLLHQLLPLAVNLLYQAAAHGANAANEEVEYLIFREEERIVDNVKRLTQRLAVYYKRNVGLRSTLRTGYHINTVASQRAEQLTGDTWGMLHVLAYDGYGSQVLLGLYGRNLAHHNFLGKLFVQHFASQVGIGIAHTDGCRVLRRCLRHEEDANAVLGQRLEYAVVDTDDAHHTETLHSNEARIINRRNTLDGLTLRIGNFLLNDGTFALGIESVLYQDRNVLVADGVDGRRIDYLGTEVTKFGSFHVAQLLDGVGSGDDTRIGGHEAVHIGPDFQTVGIERSGHNGCRVVRTSAAQVGHDARRLVGSNEARYQRTAGQFAEGLTHQAIGLVGIENVFREFLFCLDELTRVAPFGPCQTCRNERRQAFAIAYDGVAGLLRQVFYQVYALKDVLQFVEQLAHFALQGHLLFACRNNFLHHLDVAVDYFLEFVLVRSVACRCQPRGIEQLISNAAQGRYDNDDRLVDRFHYFLHTQDTACGSYGRTAKLHYFHYIRLFLLTIIDN